MRTCGTSARSCPRRTWRVATSSTTSRRCGSWSPGRSRSRTRSRARPTSLVSVERARARTRSVGSWRTRLSAGSVKFAHVIEIPAPPDRAFSFLLDLPRVARCLPGASDLRAGDHDRYLGDLRVDIGPFHLTLAGDVTILSRDEPTRTVTLRAVGDDPRAGGIRAAITMRAQHSGAGTRLLLDSDVQVVGRLARLGRLLVKRKADQLIAGFARNVARELGA
ncbi:MAG: hypothetical protein E6I87_01900 [Chloroflexi bacterium]|nr:MAG: hypothetical protein E6I87_01900 [Chloroflexota bacterium]